MFHGLAMAACLFNTLPVVLRVLAFAAVVCSFMQSFEQHCNSARVIELRYSDSRGWALGDGIKRLPISLLASTISTSWIVVLHYRPPQQSKQTLLILRDAVTTEEYRQLRVALRIAPIA